MHQYLDMLRNILTVGVQKGDRTGTGTYSVFGYQMRFDLKQGFPLVTTKKVHLKSIIHELLWFLSGSTNTKYLTDNGVTIWQEWAAEDDIFEEKKLELTERFSLYADIHPVNGIRSIENDYRQSGYDDVKMHREMDIAGVPREQKIKIQSKGDLGRVYGAQWRDWIGPNGEHIDQITNVINDLKANPDSRRLIVTAWQPAEIEKMALPPCHCFFQFWTRELSYDERIALFNKSPHAAAVDPAQPLHGAYLDSVGIPERALSCQLYQRKQNCALAA